MIKFNKPFLTSNEFTYIADAVEKRKLSGNGQYTQLCQQFFEDKYGFKKCLLTTSCTDALEMCAILLDIKSEDEIIMPSFTFVSTANAFVLRGANVVFCDSSEQHPNIDPGQVEKLITAKTKAIVVVHYAGVACDMDKIMNIASKHNLLVVEDAAQAIDSYYKGRPLGGIGHLAAFSFHETKNISSGEGGMLVVNDSKFADRAEIIWEKGTNRAAFYKGQVDKYNWVDIGSSYLPSEITAAFLWAQLEGLEDIQAKRKSIYNYYLQLLKPLEEKGLLKLPRIPNYATNNGHMFYILCKTNEQRESLIYHLKQNDILAVFHYLPLHKSPFFKNKYKGKGLPICEAYSDHIIRLPFYYDLKLVDLKFIVNRIEEY